MNRIDLNKVKRYSVLDRKTKSNIKSFAKAPKPIKSFFEALPDFLKAADLKALARDIVDAQKRGRGIIWMMGAHPIKVGLSPVIIDLIKNGCITHLALNGASAIHDLEIAFWGQTSEEVAESLSDGSFGMVKETPLYLAEALSESDNETGIGEAVGGYIHRQKPEFASYSILACAYKYKIPVSIHIAIGTDTICQHPEFDAAIWGCKSHLDFKMLAESIKNIHNKGLIINFGSAVVLPEVFLKALTTARNIYGKITDFSAANFDMIQHYRPNENVVKRPTIDGGRRYIFTGHHEIMMPLLSAAIKSFKKQKE
ncbi:MAG: hypothetical protein J7K40_09040 [candidate division Zixibacteria bacterium]|nr:hypothetical protein [candidate division Zixibacteria bacterium]